MKNSAAFSVAATTLVLLTVAIMTALNVSFALVFFTTLLGQGMMVLMVYIVLTDTYSSNKTFEDFYEDHPKGDEN